MTLDSPADPPSLLWRFESEFLRPYRGAILLGLLGLVVQSVLLLPIPLLQGWVVDHLVAYFRAEQTTGSPGTIPAPGSLGAQGPSTTAFARPTKTSVARAIFLVLVATIVLHLLRAAVAWKVAAMMGRISQEVVVALRGRLAPQADAAADGLLRFAANRPSDGTCHQRRRQHLDVYPQRHPPGFERPHPLPCHRDLAWLAPVAAGSRRRDYRAALRPQSALLFRHSLRRLSDEIRAKCHRSMPF